MAVGLQIGKEKKNGKFLTWCFGLLVVIAVGFTGWYYYNWYTTGNLPPVPMPMVSAAQPGISTKKPTAKDVTNYTVPPTHPRYITIPVLGIDRARVGSVDVTPDNNLDVPKNIYDTAWYDKSMTPGTGYGAVVIDGHSGGYANNGVFSKLAALKVGDEITIERGDGKKFTYVVLTNQTMSLQEANKSGMKTMMQSANPDKEGLSLISCAGNYVPRLGQFDKRVMVQAVRTN